MSIGAKIVSSSLCRICSLTMAPGVLGSAGSSLFNLDVANHSHAPGVSRIIFPMSARLVFVGICSKRLEAGQETFGRTKRDYIDVVE